MAATGWSEAGFEPAEAYEPDLTGDLMLGDGEFEVSVEDRLDGEVAVVNQRA